MTTRYAPTGAVAAANHLAAHAGAAMLQRGGNAVDAAIAAAAAMTVTSPHMCGLGGDLFAVVVAPGAAPATLNASGRAGAGADAERLRGEGRDRMPFHDDVRAVTVPGCVDGLVALHARFGSVSLAEAFGPAIRLARDGFPVSPTLAAASSVLTPDVRAQAFGAPDALTGGQRLRCVRVARVLDDIATGGRAAFYEGAPGEALRDVGAGLFTTADLHAVQAEWVDPLVLSVFGHDLWTTPPNSQGYLTLSSAWIAERVGVPDDPGDEAWAFTLVEAARQAAHDRVAVLHEGADGTSLLSPDRLGPRAEAVRAAASHGLAEVYGDGDTTYLCAVDADRAGASLILSNAAGFGSHLLLGEHGIFLHNRGMAFSLAPGHPAEYGPGRRPPHTLAPLAVTHPDGSLAAVMGTMGGDAQPQILLQLLARAFVTGQEPGPALRAPRWSLSREPSSGFDVWETDEPPLVRLERDAPAAWQDGLRRRGYEVLRNGPGDVGFGHAQMIRVTGDDMVCGAADPRPRDGACVGL
ncbi:MAG: gamma-glutamyltransferase family protein [Solirubrobacteraceae bacterium]